MEMINKLLERLSDEKGGTSVGVTMRLSLGGEGLFGLFSIVPKLIKHVQGCKERQCKNKTTLEKQTTETTHE